MNAREDILKRIRKGLQTAEFKKIEPVHLPNTEIYHTPDKPLHEIFADELMKINGEYHFCKSKEEITGKLRELNETKGLSLCYLPDKNLSGYVENTGIEYTQEFKDEKKIKSGISGCEFLVARFGSVMVSSALPGSRRIFSFPEIHIVIAEQNQIVLELEEALDGMMKRYDGNLPSQITNITGPSRTADIEKTLILGAHGPKQLIVLLLNQ
ncbi:MAG: lactate utilization protein [Bacteroidales bacterium]